MGVICTGLNHIRFFFFEEDSEEAGKKDARERMRIVNRKEVKDCMESSSSHSVDSKLAANLTWNLLEM